MDENVFKKLEQQILGLVDAYQSLQVETNELRQQQRLLIQERDHLLEKNKTATEEMKQVIEGIRAAKNNYKE